MDDTFASGRRADAKKFTEDISKRFNITIQEEVKKHLGVDYEWGEDKFGPYAKASMDKYKKEIVELYEELTRKELKEWPTPAYPNTTLVKSTDPEPLEQGKYRSIVGKVMHWNRKIGVECNNATREVSKFMKHPGKEHWKALERYCGYVKTKNYTHLLY